MNIVPIWLSLHIEIEGLGGWLGSLNFWRGSMKIEEFESRRPCQSQSWFKSSSQSASQGSKGSDYIEVHEPSDEGDLFYVREPDVTEQPGKAKQAISPIKASTQTRPIRVAPLSLLYSQHRFPGG